MTEATPFLRKYDITFLCPPTIPGRTSLALRGILLLSLCVFAFWLRVFVCLFRVVEFKIVDADGIAVLDALLLQTVEQAAFAELAVKVHAGFVIIEVDIIQELLEPFA